MISYIGDRTPDSPDQHRVIRHKENGDTELDPGPSLKLFNHSPTGFSWGYGGSGPAQLALAILLDFTGDPEIAVRFHQTFKTDKISCLEDRFVLTDAEIQRWLDETRKKYN
jgi:hypothetical protein